jgi:hypothetical protein
MLKVKTFKTYNMVGTNVGELLNFHPIFNPIVNLDITLVPWTIQHKLYIFLNAENFKNHFLQITKCYEGIFHLLKWKFQK